MAAQIIHHDLPFSQIGGNAERKILDFLKLLPDNYFVVRECKVSPSALKRASGSLEDRPDFVVIGPEVGVVVLEVKDWNIRDKSSYEFVDQCQVRKTDGDGRAKTLKNPYAQAAEYRNAVSGILEDPRSGSRLWVSSFVAYPFLTRTAFENSCRGMRKDTPQQQFSFDLSKTLFSDELNAYWEMPLKLLHHYVFQDLKAYHRSMITYTAEQVNATVRHLVPAELRIGGQPDYSEAEKGLAFLDEQQQKWAFGLTEKTYLSDVAGSGKTNVLLSRAIYWAEQHITTGGCRILVATYSKPLKEELRRIFRDKIRDDLDKACYEQSIDIYDVVSLMEELSRTGMGRHSFETWRAQQLSSRTEDEYIEEKLPEKCFDILSEHTMRFQIYDYLLIDEIQDFSTWFLYVAINLLKNHENIFTVGDIGQQLFDRELEWGEFDIVRQRVEIQSRFLMYRSLKPVAKLAWKFLISDRFILQDLKEGGYKKDIKPGSPFTSKPELIPGANEEELLEYVRDDVRARWSTARPSQILCIGLKHEMLGCLYDKLLDASIPVCWATEFSSERGECVVLADYIESKGLEREYVYILDADRLARKTSPFASVEQTKKEVRRDRIKLFVALTRAIREVRLYYIDHYHTFIRELLQTQSTL